VHVFEKYAKAGGLLRYGIPDFKMEKHVIDRRVTQMEAEGVVFHYGTHVGGTGQGAIDPREMLNHYDVVALTGGAEAPRDLLIPGRDLAGIHFAMDFLPQQNRRVSSEPSGGAADILAGGKHVVVIGGGDTGSDCIGTSNRQGAASVTQLEIMPQPPERENKAMTWPDWPYKLRTSSSQEEGAERDWAVLTKKACGANGQLEALECVRLEWTPGPDGRQRMTEIAGSEFQLKADLVLLAMGFLGPHPGPMLKQAEVELDARGNVKADMIDYRSSTPKIFACGDMRRGQSLVVWAIREGRQCARAVDEFLMGSSELPR
jgi:glutamate synthase (NADPH) small chain